MSIRFSIAVFVLMAVAFSIQRHAVAQISPGELSKVHAHLEGISNCTKCHILGQKVSSQKCLDCHTEIKSRINRNAGYHASSEIRGKECVACHSDHHGLNFQIIRFKKESFNHQLTGYPLLGAHAGKQCTDCHKPSLIRDPAARKKKFTYLGLNTDCLSCHADYHQATLSKTCSECHGNEAFKPAIKFDHSKSAFRLAGKHQEVACASCHKITQKNGLKYQEFKGLKFDNCARCHKDVHNNKFGQNCAQCHTEQSFNIIRGVDNFNHEKTNFPLRGLHRKVSCNDCHKNKFTAGMQYNRCDNCHKDYHKGQLTRQGVSPDCAECHTVDGFSDFIYGTEQHTRSSFPLKGAHLATPCIACHLKPVNAPDTAWRFREIGNRCSDCHDNIHQGFISDKYLGDLSCERCHNESRWSEIRFDHTTTRFALEGAHQSQSCRACHFRQNEAGKVVQQFRELPVSCSSCHADIHAGQFIVNGVITCDRCHGLTAFKPATRFDHQKTNFPLDGKHRDLACIKCHKPVQKNGSTYILYKIKEFRCEDCHH